MKSDYQKCLERLEADANRVSKAIPENSEDSMLLISRVNDSASIIRGGNVEALVEAIGALMESDHKFSMAIELAIEVRNCLRRCEEEQ
jgi:hypothetical protein